MDSVQEQKITVEGFDGNLPFRSFDGDLNYEVIGNLGYRDYDGRSVRTMSFLPASEQEKESPKVFNLGHRGRPSDEFKYVDHVDMIQPLVDIGFIPSMTHNKRGGVGLFSTFTHDDYSFENTIGWDLSMFGSEGEAASGMKLAIGIKFDGRLNKPITYTAGFFRVICTNGLITKYLNLGFMKQSPQNFDPFAVSGFAQQVLENSGFDSPAFPTRALGWGINTIMRTVEDEGYLATLPDFARAPVNTLVERTPKWYRQSFVGQLQAAYNSDQQALTMTDMVNAVTNAANAKEDGASRIYFSMETLIKALINVIAIGAFKSDVELPPAFARMSNLG